MAESKPANSTRAASPREKPKLVALAEEATPAQPAAEAPRTRLGERERGDVPKRLFTAVVVLLALSLVALLAQTRRVASRDDQIALLSTRIGGLEAQLAAAHSQIARYDRQLAQVRSSVSEILEQMTRLSELVESPAPPPAALSEGSEGP